MNYCCAQFGKQAGELRPTVGEGLYPREMRPAAQFVADYDGWSIYGCCGGGCTVVDVMRFCPFCGAKLESPTGKPWKEPTPEDDKP